VDDEVGSDIGAELVAELDHFAEFVRGIDVEKGEGDAAGMEGLLGETHHDGGIFADGVKHDGARKFGDDFPEDVDAFGFEDA
jgi:hypothetical protein